MEILRTENLNFIYPDGRQALSDISFSLEEGEMMCVCGPTGSGKSTLLRLLKRELSPRGEKSGDIFISGRKQEELSDFEAATRIGFVFQRPDMQIVTDKVWHELAFGLENIGIKQNEIRRRVCEIAGYFGMESWFDRSTDSLSGGQKQLLNLASVMVMQPDILILDEPVSQLDPITASDFIATLTKLCREFGISIIAAEQRLGELIPVSDRILAIKDGKTVAFGETRDCVRTLIKDEAFAVSMPASVKLYEKIMSASGKENPKETDNASHEEKTIKTDSATLKEEPINTDRATLAEEPVRTGITHSKEDHKGGDIPLSVGEGRRFLKEYLKSPESDPRILSEVSGSEDTRTLHEDDKENAAEKQAVSRVEANKENAAEKQADRDKKDSRRKDIETVLEFKEVYLKYERNGRDILRACGFKVGKGEVFCILGGNGAGKSTAISAAAGLIKPYSGKIRVFGKNIGDYKGQELYNECVAMLPQDVQTVFITDEINGRHPYDLSGGEQQLAALDIVLASKPKLLLLDEPTKGLDAVLGEELKKKLKKLAADGVTIVIVSHDIEFSASIADRCAMLFNGEVVSVGEARDFFKGNYFYTTAYNRIMRGMQAEK
ncbi:MAG: ATP-binding cassette domain-containing protein [Lachnospiraceae bacterium]|nr:ATP-binding cassette domain-containing protein [Lachnospiraceae bacterium]